MSGLSQLLANFIKYRLKVSPTVIVAYLLDIKTLVNYNSGIVVKFFRKTLVVVKPTSFKVERKYLRTFVKKQRVNYFTGVRYNHIKDFLSQNKPMQADRLHSNYYSFVFFDVFTLYRFFWLNKPLGFYYRMYQIISSIWVYLVYAGMRKIQPLWKHLFGVTTLGRLQFIKSWWFYTWGDVNSFKFFPAKHIIRYPSFFGRLGVTRVVTFNIVNKVNTNLGGLWMVSALFVKNCIIACILTFAFLLWSMFLLKINVVKAAAIWVLFALFGYWLLSGFNFFLKRYRFGKFTTAIQRFWKRAFMCFWMIEGFLFLIFLFYMLNNSAEPIFMYDSVGRDRFQLINIRNFMVNSVFIVTLINLCIFIVISIKFLSIRKYIVLLLPATLILVFFLLIESYQFYYIINFYDEFCWVFSEDDNIWELEIETPRTRSKNHNMVLCLLAKFWHFVFIFITWVFTLQKVLESKRLRYNLFSVNLQNIIIFYIMSWIFLGNWLKFLFHRFFELPYFWFFVRNKAPIFPVWLSDCTQSIIAMYNLGFNLVF